MAFASSGGDGKSFVCYKECMGEQNMNDLISKCDGFSSRSKYGKEHKDKNPGKPTPKVCLPLINKHDGCID
ncbi:hypothetical protein Ciccas_014273, partial [Cichlidogyrus casuarinus]